MTRVPKELGNANKRSCSEAASNEDVGDATPLEGDEKLPSVMGLQLLIVQEPSLERDARNDVFPPLFRRPNDHQYNEQSRIATRIHRAST